MGTNKSTARKWVGRIVYLMFLILVVEIALQGFYFFTSGGFVFSRVAVPIFTTDPHSVWAVQPNLSYHHATSEFSIDVFTNSEGFRTSSAREEYAKSHADDLFRIIVLGPSFAFGWGVDHEDSFAQILQARLLEVGFGDGRRIEVINRGIPGLPAAHNLEWYRQVGRNYAPDLVIQFMYGSMLPARPPNNYVDEDGFLRDKNVTARQRLVAQAKKSAVVFYTWMVYTRLRSESAESGATGTIEGAGRDLSVREAFDPESQEVRDAAIFYDDLRRTVEDSGARLLVFHFPLSYVVHSEDMARWRHLGVRNVDQQIAYNDAFAQHLDREGYVCLNGTSDLVDHAESTSARLYYWLDVHWTPEGNSAAADSVAEYLQAHRDWALGTERTGADRGLSE
jgi:hypothetical protein